MVIENRDALTVIAAHDGPQTLHYIDPPYLPRTRDPGSDYAREMSAGDHAALLDALRGLEGMVVLSGYPSGLYDAALPDWRRVEHTAYADGARARTEVLWINPAAVTALDAAATPLLAWIGRGGHNAAPRRRVER